MSCTKAGSAENPIAGKQRMGKIYDLADVYHCDNMERVSDDFIEQSEIKEGRFDNVAECKIRVENSYARRYNHIKEILMDYFSRVH